ncbi:MAG: hypothetical protein AAGA12_13305 [Pseudomonadota bacterium]
MFLIDRLNEFNSSNTSRLRIAIPAMRARPQPVVREEEHGIEDLRTLIKKDLRSIMKSEPNTCAVAVARRVRAAR